MKRILSAILIFVLAMSMFTPISIADTFTCNITISDTGAVEISGRTEGQYESGSVIVRDENDIIVHIGQFKSGDDRQYSEAFQLSSNADDGTYRVEMHVANKIQNENFIVKSDDDSSDNDSGDSGSSGGNSKPTHIYLSVKGPDGYILGTKQYLAKGGETVEDVAIALFKEYDIDFDDPKKEGYFNRIGGISAFDYGPLSGWKYTINGSIGDGIRVQSASAGDRIKFYYVIDYTKDSKESGSNVIIGGATSGSAYTSETHPREILKDLKNGSETKINSTNANLYKMAALATIKDIAGKAAAGNLNADAGELIFISKTIVDSMDYETSVFSATVTAKNLVTQFDSIANATSDENVKSLINEKKAELAEKLAERARTVFVSTKGAVLKPGYLEIQVDDAVKEIVESYKTNVEKVEDALTRSGLDKNVLNKKIVTLRIEDGKNGYEMNFSNDAIKALKEFEPDKIKLKTDKAEIALDASFIKDTESSFKLKMQEEVKNKIPGEEKDKEPVLELYMEKNGKDVSEFEMPVTVTVPLEHDSNEARTVYFIKADGTKALIGGNLSKDGKSMTFKTNHFSKFTVDKLDMGFEDIDGHTKKAEIEKAVCRGILSGRDKRTFDPESTVTRGELVMMLQNITKYPSHSQNQSFDDVSTSDWFYDAVEMATGNEFVSGRGDGTFDPYGVLTLEEIAVIVSKVMDANGFESYNLAAINSASDSGEISNWAVSGLAKALDYGLVGLDEEGRISPKSQVSRAETAEILNALYTLLY